MPPTDRKLELKANTSVAQTGSQPFVYAKGLKDVIAIQKCREGKTSRCEIIGLFYTSHMQIGHGLADKYHCTFTSEQI
jgi:hypothetical protein